MHTLACSTSIASATATALLGLSATTYIGDPTALSIARQHLSHREYTHSYTEVRLAAVRLLGTVGDWDTIQVLGSCLEYFEGSSSSGGRGSTGGKRQTRSSYVGSDVKKLIQDAVREIEVRAGRRSDVKIL
jgi:hypothetical protein